MQNAGQLQRWRGVVDWRCLICRGMVMTEQHEAPCSCVRGPRPTPAPDGESAVARGFALSGLSVMRSGDSHTEGNAANRMLVARNEEDHTPPIAPRPPLSASQTVRRVASRTTRPDHSTRVS